MPAKEQILQQEQIRSEQTSKSNTIIDSLELKIKELNEQIIGQKEIIQHENETLLQKILSEISSDHVQNSIFNIMWQLPKKERQSTICYFNFQFLDTIKLEGHQSDAGLNSYYTEIKVTNKENTLLNLNQASHDGRTTLSSEMYNHIFSKLEQYTKDEANYWLEKKKTNTLEKGEMVILEKLNLPTTHYYNQVRQEIFSFKRYDSEGKVFLSSHNNHSTLYSFFKKWYIQFPHEESLTKPKNKLPRRKTK